MANLSERYAGKPMKLLELERFAATRNCRAVLDGDNKVARLFDELTGLFMWTIPLC